MNGPRPQLLVVDDVEANLIAVRAIVESLECDVVIARSGEEALRQLLRTEFFAVLLDVQMPGIDGYEVAQYARSNQATRDVPIIFLTARHGTEEDVLRGYGTGAVDYLPKPISPVVLQSKVRVFLELHRRRKDAELAYSELRITQDRLIESAKEVAKATEQLRLSEELAREKKLLDDLMNHSPDGIYFKNAELQFLRANKVAAAWLGQSVSSLVGKRLTELEPVVEDARRIERAEKRCLEQGLASLDTVRQIDLGGEPRWLSERKAPILSPTGETVGLVAISRDITEQKELEQRLLHSQKMDAVGRLAGGVAHDFNNLLVIIQGYADLAQERFEEDSPGRADIKELLGATDRAAALIRQLLTFSRKTAVTTVRLDLNQVVTDLEKMLSRLVDANIRIDTELESGLPSTQGDTTQFEQILLNLVVNARDAMPEGGTLTLSTSQARLAFGEPGGARNYLHLSVRDTGIGMSDSVAKRIFEPFFSTKEIGKGTGLGLSTVYGIVRQWDGHIRVESQEGVGTCFDVYFPVAAETANAPALQPEITKPSRGDETILIVEDDPDVRQLTARVLREQGYSVLEAGTPSEARQRFSEAPSVDLLISDVNMPEVSGYRLAEELTEREANLRLLFMSGYAELPSAMSEVHHLDKPFSPDQLTLAVRTALS